MNRLFEVENTKEKVESLLDSLEEYLQQTDLAQETVLELRLISEEILINTVSYGYQPGAKDTLQVHISQVDQCLILEFRDKARPFNPIEAEVRDLEDDRIGGWGIHLMKELADSLEYAYRDDQNILIMRKEIKK